MEKFSAFNNMHPTQEGNIYQQKFILTFALAVKTFCKR